jgi:hypothetical protein
MLTPVPNTYLMRLKGAIEYNSDIIEFHHDCHWEAPQFSNISGTIVVASAGQQWLGATVRSGQVNIGKVLCF